MKETKTIPEALAGLAGAISNMTDGFADFGETVAFKMGVERPELPENGNDVTAALECFFGTIEAVAKTCDRVADKMRDMIVRRVEKPLEIPNQISRDLDAEGPDARLPGEIPAEAPPDLDSIPWPIRSRMGAEALLPTPLTEAEKVELWQAAEAVLEPEPTPEPAPVEDAETPAVIPSEPGNNGRHRPAKKGGNRRGG